MNTVSRLLGEVRRKHRRAERRARLSRAFALAKAEAQGETLVSFHAVMKHLYPADAIGKDPGRKKRAAEKRRRQRAMFPFGVRPWGEGTS